MRRVSAAEALQSRVAQIIATGDDELAGEAWHALSRIVRAFTERELAQSPVSAGDMDLCLRWTRRP